MKRLSIIFLLASAVFIAQAQELPVNGTTNKVTYTDVIQAPGQSNTTLFMKAKKWIASKNTETNPYIISLENEKDGTIVGKGTFSLPGDRRKYTVQFTINISTKDDKCKYTFTDFMIQFRTQATSSSGGFGYWGGSTHKAAETLEYSLETFYPSRLDSKKPVIKGYEEIRSTSFETINNEIQSLSSSLKLSIASKEDW